jgi:hypothetical protein
MTASHVFDHSGALNMKLLRAESDRSWTHDEGREGTRVRNGHLLNASMCTLGKELELELLLLLVYMKSVTEYHWGHPRFRSRGEGGFVKAGIVLQSHTDCMDLMSVFIIQRTPRTKSDIIAISSW